MSGAVIHVGGSAPQFGGFADFFDGKTAALQRVELSIADDGLPGAALIITPPQGAPCRWPLADIRRVPDQAGRDGIALRLSDNLVARLLIRDDLACERGLTTRCPNLKKKPKVKGRARLFGWAVGAVASVALIILVLIPVMADQLAAFLPPEGEKALGDTTYEQIRTGLDQTGMAPLRECVNAKGVLALEEMRARLEAGVTLPYPLTVHVLDHHMVNAFALPGGHVVFFRGLIDAAENPDEVAAVFAHEIGHVASRDPARIALRSAGSIGVLGLLFGDFAGGAIVLFLTERLVQASYTKEAEAGADEFAHDLLIKAAISPEGLATMFERLQEEGGEPDGFISHFMSHPALGDRIANARAAARAAGVEFSASLDDEQWKELKEICGWRPRGYLRDSINELSDIVGETPSNPLRP